MSSRPPERGMSLMEVLVAAGLALLLGTMILGVIVPSMRISQREWARMELEQAAALAKEKIMVAGRETSDHLAFQVGQRAVQHRRPLTRPVKGCSSFLFRPLVGAGRPRIVL